MPAIEHPDAHPDDELLNSVLNRQLPQPELERILAHLDVCPRCDRRLDELNPELRQYRIHCSAIEKRLEAHVWPDIQTAMERFDSQAASRVESRARKPVARVFTRPAQVLMRPAQILMRPAWFGALAAAALICALLIWPRWFHSELRAEVLLEKARKASATPSARARLRVTTSKGSFLRPAVWHGVANKSGVEVEFASAHYDWSDPLNAVSYADWRNRTKHNDTVIVERNQVTGQPERYAVQTVADDSTLRQAALTLDAPTLSASSARFVFADREWVEVTRIPDAPEEVAPVSPVTAVVPSVGASAAAELPVIEREFRVRAAIDQLQAPAGTPVRVDVQPGGEILVTAYHLSAEQQRNLEASLAGIAGVTIRQAGQDADGQPALVAPEPPVPTDSILNASESILSRASLLSQLADRFPLDKEAELSLPERKTLWEMRARHAQQMGRDIETLGRLLAGSRPVGAGKLAGEISTADANFSVAAMVQAAGNVDHLVTALYAGGDAGVDPVSGWPQLTAELNQLRQFCRSYQKLAERRLENSK
ncbi:MAG TPA: zf-HC2 domain-containing protein [Bryobacteraceae bacterium]|jgi:hypothetical protein|nr:zf-HC2 domain-containing protein [Bryobacteraceae bacterium]